MGGKRILRLLVCLSLVMALMLGTLSAQAAAKTVTVLQLKNDYVRIRSSTGEGSQVVGTLRAGTKMFYFGRSNSMAYVGTENGQRGYVYAGYLEKYGEVRVANVYYVQSSSLTVYTSPSTSAGRATTLGKNRFILLTDANGNWGRIRSLNGNTGYVLLSGLRRASM